jgi:hypothetical protein
MFLLVCTVDPDKTLSFVLGLGKLDVQFLVGLCKMCDFVVEGILLLIEVLDSLFEMRDFGI